MHIAQDYILWKLTYIQCNIMGQSRMVTSPSIFVHLSFKNIFDRSKTANLSNPRTNSILKEVEDLRLGITRVGHTESVPFHEWNFSIGSPKLNIPYCGSPLENALQAYCFPEIWYLQIEHYIQKILPRVLQSPSNFQDECCSRRKAI